MKKFFVYILESEIDKTLYIGQTNNISERIKKHNKGLVKSTKAKRPYQLCYFEEFKTRADAMKREWDIKKSYNSERRRKLISSFNKCSGGQSTTLTSRRLVEEFPRIIGACST